MMAQPSQELSPPANPGWFKMGGNFSSQGVLMSEPANIFSRLFAVEAADHFECRSRCGIKFIDERL